MAITKVCRNKGTPGCHNVLCGWVWDRVYTHGASGHHRRYINATQCSCNGSGFYLEIETQTGRSHAGVISMWPSTPARIKWIRWLNAAYVCTIRPSEVEVVTQKCRTCTQREETSIGEMAGLQQATQLWQSEALKLPSYFVSEGNGCRHWCWLSILPILKKKRENPRGWWRLCCMGIVIAMNLDNRKFLHYPQH